MDPEWRNDIKFIDVKLTRPACSTCIDRRTCWSPITVVFFLIVSSAAGLRRALETARPSSMSIRPLISVTSVRARLTERRRTVVGTRQPFTSQRPPAVTRMTALTNRPLHDRLPPLFLSDTTSGCRTASCKQSRATSRCCHFCTCVCYNVMSSDLNSIQLLPSYFCYLLLTSVISFLPVMALNGLSVLTCH